MLGGSLSGMVAQRQPLTINLFDQPQNREFEELLAQPRLKCTSEVGNLRHGDFLPPEQTAAIGCCADSESGPTLNLSASLKHLSAI